MHSTAFFQILTLLCSTLVSVSSTNIDPSSGITDLPTVRGEMQYEYKRRSTSYPLENGPVRAPAAVAAQPHHPLLECHGNLPPPHTLGNAQATAFASLLDWCLRGPAQCRCVYHASTRTYDVDCAMDDNRLDTAPGIVACHNQCDCGQFIDRPTLESMASGALQLGRGRTGLA